MRHRNVVNIPSRGLYPLRSLFIASKGKVIIGCDGAGLELRMLAHFMNDPEYTDTVLNGDIHTYNQEKAGLSERDMAKLFIYAFLYGSGIPNLARICGVSESEMAATIERFKAELPALSNLLDRVQTAGGKLGYLLSLDGRRGRIRSKRGELSLHTALNVLLQMTGSIVMKWGHIVAEDQALSDKLIDDVLDFPMVAHQHDEAQMEGDESLVERKEYTIDASDWKEEEKRPYQDDTGRLWSAPRITKGNPKVDSTLTLTRSYHPLGEVYANGIKKAGELLGLRCPTAGEYMIGNSWSDTH